MAVKLSRVDELIKAIQENEGNQAGVNLTGGSNYRCGVRSDAIFKARSAVRALRSKMLQSRMKLKDGTLVDQSVFTDDLAGFLMLLVSYMIVGELKYGKADYEEIAKAYLPLNV